MGYLVNDTRLISMICHSFYYQVKMSGATLYVLEPEHYTDHSVQNYNTLQQQTEKGIKTATAKQIFGETS